ncbi:unnamed protein product [Echinostoma caproni]|uniref:histone deacetylase n=1 Tax=Echinostoma caproni TaxID=27848 RepID=A0A3P8HKY3_9TREM|nr:unnamed protein product [Echinostoma caproni]
MAAGSVKSLTQLIVQGRLLNGLALVRPPGHHAMHAEACGYCIFNNVAVAAASLLASPPNGLSASLPSSIAQLVDRPRSCRIRVSRYGNSESGRVGLVPRTGLSDNATHTNSKSPVTVSATDTLKLTRDEVTAGSGLTPILERILIVDWDVHHGQGTQYAFYEDNRSKYSQQA